jgi:hypothetical protein
MRERELQVRVSDSENLSPSPHVIRDNLEKDGGRMQGEGLGSSVRESAPPPLSPLLPPQPCWPCARIRAAVAGGRAADAASCRSVAAAASSDPGSMRPALAGGGTGDQTLGGKQTADQGTAGVPKRCMFSHKPSKHVWFFACTRA